MSERAGELGAGGYHAFFAQEDAAEHIEFQYADMSHQADTATSGMWLFLASELLFFGGMFLVFAVYSNSHRVGLLEGSRHTELAIGTINTALLLASSAVFTYGASCARRGRNRAVFWASAMTAVLGVGFLLLKGIEWSGDFAKHLFPGPGFAVQGADAGGAELFWCFYFVMTALHGLHMIVGIGLVGWIARNAARGRYSPAYSTPVEIVGLYWSFVDMIWLVLYPTIYLVGRIGAWVPLVGACAAALVAMTFMRLPKSGPLAGVFAMAGVFWLCILMGMGSLDPVTRHDLPVVARTQP